MRSGWIRNAGRESKDDITQSPQPALLAYSTANFGKSVLWDFLQIYGLVYATDTLGLEPAFAGLLILITLIWDGISDPLVGVAVDQVSVFRKRYSSVILGAALIAASLLPLIFSIHWAPPEISAPLFLILLLLFRTAFTFVDIPENALFSRLTSTDREQILGASSRKIMALFGGLAVTWSTAWTIGHTGLANEGDRIFITAVVAAPAVVTTVFVGLFAVRRSENHVPLLPRQQNHARIFLSVLKDDNIRSLCLHNFFAVVGLSLFSASLIYFARSVYGEGDWFPIAMSILLCTKIGGVIFWSWLAVRVGTLRALTLCVAVCIVSVVGFRIFDAPNISLVFLSILGASSGGLMVLRWALAPSIIKAVHVPAEITATAMALFCFSIKSAVGASAFMLGLILSYAEYEAGIVMSSNEAAEFRTLVTATIAVSISFSLIPLLVMRRVSVSRAAPVSG